MNYNGRKYLKSTVVHNIITMAMMMIMMKSPIPTTLFFIIDAIPQVVDPRFSHASCIMIYLSVCLYVYRYIRWGKRRFMKKSLLYNNIIHIIILLVLFVKYTRCSAYCFGLNPSSVYTPIKPYSHIGIYNINTLSIPACGYTSVNTPNIITNANYNTCTLLFRRYTTYDNENK